MQLARLSPTEHHRVTQKSRKHGLGSFSRPSTCKRFRAWSRSARRRRLEKTLGPIPCTSVPKQRQNSLSNQSVPRAPDCKRRRVLGLHFAPIEDLDGGDATTTGFFDAAAIDAAQLWFPVQPPEAVARTALRAWDSRKALAISGWKNRLLVLGRFAPRWLLVRMSAVMMGHWSWPLLGFRLIHSQNAMAVEPPIQKSTRWHSS